MSGNTVRMLLKGEEEITRDQRQIQSLPAPVMWQGNAPIVISQYGSYASESLPRYWNATLPDIKERYGQVARYEHHDVPVPNQSLTEYKLATVGRAIQHKAGDESFWSWFNTIMVDGVQSITEGCELVDQLDIDVERSYLEEAVTHNLYSNVIWEDIYSVMGKGSAETQEEIEQQLEHNDAVFAIFVNGVPVDPSYDSIVGAVEEIRAAQTQAAAQERVAQQQQTRREKRESGERAGQPEQVRQQNPDISPVENHGMNPPGPGESTRSHGSGNQ